MMGSGGERVEEEEKVIRKKLALAVKSIKWSYSIFWSLSSTQSGVLEWRSGYYNGDIKTRKTVVQCAENSREEEEDDGDELKFGGIERTEQIIQLYEELLSASENNNPTQPKRLSSSSSSSASLSPEDLTDAEWYFLVCMSFSFPIGQGLPGRTFANNQTIWLCNAHHADSKVFSRSLLAKSASIQTVVCFPYTGGVIELGVTELVLEDPKIIQHIKTSILEIPSAIASNISINERELAIEIDQDIDILEEANNSHSPNKISSKFEPVDQVQSLQDDEISNHVIQISTTSSDNVSQTSTSTNKLDESSDDGHYKRVLSTLLKTSNCLILGPSFRNGKLRSSFVSWKKAELSGSEFYKHGRSQRLLKKVIFEVGLMHGGCLFQSLEGNRMRDKLLKQKGDEVHINHVLLEKRRRKRINKRFSILKELVPFTNKVDKASVLDNTIEYLKELERKVEELGSFKEENKAEETRAENKASDAVERISDNYGDTRILIKKRKKIVTKACNPEELVAEKIRILTKGGSTDDVSVSKIDNNVVVEIRCNWKENLFLEILGATSNLHLDIDSIQSSNADGILSLIINAQMKRSTKISIEETRQALRRVIQKRLSS